MKKLLAAIVMTGAMACSTMAQASQPLVEVDWVNANLGNAGVVFLDVRGRLAGKSKSDYLRAHIPGAVWTNYLKDGWRAKDKNGTVGQLSPTAKLEKLIGGLGIDNSSHVVIVPQGNKALDMGTATRIYWTFKVLGHKNVSILNGGMKAYAKIDPKTKKPINKLDKGAVKPAAKTFKASLQKDMLLSKAVVQMASKNGGVLVDNRPHNQFLGINKHGKSKRPGTIPGATNLPENWLTQNGGGKFRVKEQLAKLFTAANVPTTGKQVNFCNSGHWASLGWFASHEIMGNKEAKLYDGSMIEWSADKSLPMDQKVKLN